MRESTTARALLGVCEDSQICVLRPNRESNRLRNGNQPTVISSYRLAAAFPPPNKLAAETLVEAVPRRKHRHEHSTNVNAP